mgnify:CR=1 FL=1
MKTAPEKIHVLPIAAIVLKELLKRFKVDNIVISDTGFAQELFNALRLVLCRINIGHVLAAQLDRSEIQAPPQSCSKSC